MSTGTWPTFLDDPNANPACRGEDTDLFFPEPGDTGAEAKAICARCPIKATCADWALGQPINDVHGVWGGLSQVDRKRLQRVNNSNDTSKAKQTCQLCGVYYGNFLRMHVVRVHADQPAVAA